MALETCKTLLDDPTQKMPSTPSRNSSSPKGPMTELRTPIASTSLLDNDSPLPSPPSISKPTSGGLRGSRFTSSDDEGDKENALPGQRRTASPTPGPVKVKSRRSGEDASVDAEVLVSERSPQARSLAAALGAPAPPPTRRALEHKLGIRPAASRGTGVAARSVSHASGSSSRMLKQDEANAMGSMSRSASDALSHRQGGVQGEDARPPSSSSRPIREGPRALSSALSRSRDGTEERDTAPQRDDVASTRKRHSPDGFSDSPFAVAATSTSSAAASKPKLPNEDYNGKLSGGSDSAGRTSSPSPDLVQNGSGGSIEERPLNYLTPALAPGARSMRSLHTSTAGRSTGRTLKRFGNGEARPMHVRPARVMLVQGADDTDGEDEEGEGVGVGTVGAQAAVHDGNAPASTPSPGTSNTSLNGGDNGTPASNQATKGYSPLPTETKSRPPTDTGARRRRVVSDRGGPNNGASSSTRAPLTSSRSPQDLSEEKKVGESGQPSHNASSQGDDDKRPDGSHGAGASSEPSSRTHGARRALDEVLQAKVEPHRGAGLRRMPIVSSAQPSREKSPPLSERPAASTPRAAASYPPIAAGSSSPRADGMRIAELEPEIEAEKHRLLDLNGWDKYVHAALEEAQRQRHNGCQFGERPVGKVLTHQKETKFRGAKYMKVSRAGEGGFSTVFQVLGPTAIPTLDGGFEPVPRELQAHFAMKQVSLRKLEQSSRDELLQEAQLLETLAQVEDSDQHVLRYFGHKHSGDTLKILMELGEMDFNTLLRTQHPLSRQALSEYWRQMLEAVHFVHNAKLVHSDLKPANFLLVKGRIKLIDFGIAQKIPLGTVHISRDVIVGTPNYMAPEAIQKARRGGHGVYKAGKPSDVWSLGCILYQMIYGRTPFAHISGDRKLEVITSSKHTIAFPTRRSLDDSGSSKGANGDDAEEDDDKEEAEELDEILLNCVKSALVYDSQLRAKIPQLLEHLFVRDEVTLSRKKLKSIVFRIQAYMQQGRLTEDNVDEIADRLVTNLQLDGFVPFDPERD